MQSFLNLFYSVDTSIFCNWSHKGFIGTKVFCLVACLDGSFEEAKGFICFVMFLIFWFHFKFDVRIIPNYLYWILPQIVDHESNNLVWVHGVGESYAGQNILLSEK